MRPVWTRRLRPTAAAEAAQFVRVRLVVTAGRCVYAYNAIHLYNFREETSLACLPF